MTSIKCGMCKKHKYVTSAQLEGIETTESYGVRNKHPVCRECLDLLVKIKLDIKD